MDCVSCGLPSGYHRVLVEGKDGAELGGLCIECEQHELGERLQWEVRAETEPGQCALCARDACVRVPEWDPEMEPTPDGEVVWNEYRVTDTTPGLCEEHFGALEDRDTVEEASSRTPRHPPR